MFTALSGMFITQEHLSMLVVLESLFFIALGGGASGTLNMWYDADIDALMRRTKNRPIPAGRISKQEALILGIILSIISVVGLGVVTNWVAGFFLALTIFYYVVVYTIWLKRFTPQNIVIGGGAGALPPIIGYACITGNVNIESFILFLIIFFWTPPHFWSLCLFVSTDYSVANIPMLPNVKGTNVTKNNIIFYTILTVISSVLPYYFSQGKFYLFTVIIFDIVFIKLSWNLWKSRDNTNVIAKKLFYFSLLYLFVIFSCIIVEGIL